MFGSEKAKNGYTLMVQMYFALQINQKRRTGMNSISEKYNSILIIDCTDNVFTVKTNMSIISSEGE